MKSGPTHYRIGALGAATGETVKTLRFWTEQGLLEAYRSDANYRCYGPDASTRVTFIRLAQATGFRLRDIKTLLFLADGSIKPCNEVKKLAEARLTDVQTQLQQLHAFAAALRDLVTLPSETCPDERCHFLPVP
jgi:DNA-binding transcriptional MerR regulator